MSLLTWIGGCAVGDELAALFGPERSVPAAVMAELPVPNGARIDDEGCVGIPGREAFTCTVHLTAPLSLAAGSAEAARLMSAWDEYSWDEVPGRVQYSWQRGPEWIGLAVHDRPPGTAWSLSYTWSERPAPSPTPPVPPPSAGPEVPVPAPLDALSLPAGAELVGSATAPWTSAVWTFSGDADAWLAEQAAVGTVTFRSRTVGGRSLVVRRPEGEITWIVSLRAAGDRHRLVAHVRLP